MSERAPSSHRLQPLRHVDAGVLNVAYYEAGPADGPVAIGDLFTGLHAQMFQQIPAQRDLAFGRNGERS